MRIIIVGGGQTGTQLAERLLYLDHDPVIVEMDEQKADDISDKLKIPVIQGDGSNKRTLIKADVSEADALAAVTPKDDVNLMACKIADDLGVSRLVSRINRGKNVDIFKDEGIDATISYTSSTVGLYEKALTGPEIFGILTLGGEEADVMEVSVSGDSEALGKTIEEMELPELCTVAMVTRSGSLIPPRGDTEFKEGDRVILAGDSDEVRSVGRVMRGRESLT